ncbi:MAG TPA: L-histidine N(alpha)-methyltransferase [Candidatus Binataceae bacterium]|nr:L-histidine N(alpha)-methyltransferase [Candidatus Binataceae bacterium]
MNFDSKNRTPAEDDGEAATRTGFRSAVIEGLSRDPKTIPSKFLYDQRGSALFEQICTLPEYYPTRVESAILNRHAGEIASMCGEHCLLVELGSGSSAKTRILLDRLHSPAAYIPVDIASDQLRIAAALIARDYPQLEVLPLCADYTAPFELPASRHAPGRRVTFFPGSTIGNLEPVEAVRFIANLARTSRPGDAIIVGVDLLKSPAILEQAYNDSQGVTAAFNLNILRRMKRELGAEIQTDAFRHRAIFNSEAGRIEMHLVSVRDQVIRIDHREIPMRRGESIVTEHCYKYAVEAFCKLAAAAACRVERAWTDSQGFFCTYYLVV